MMEQAKKQLPWHACEPSWRIMASHAPPSTGSYTSTHVACLHGTHALTMGTRVSS